MCLFVRLFRRETSGVESCLGIIDTAQGVGMCLVPSQVQAEWGTAFAAAGVGGLLVDEAIF